MKTYLKQNQDIYVISIEGNLDIIGMDRFKALCNNTFKKNKLIFNLKSLSFIGSSGIDIFSETLDILKKENHLKLCCVSSEFQKILHNENLESLICDSEEEALSFFDEKKTVT